MYIYSVGKVCKQNIANRKKKINILVNTSSLLCYVNIIIMCKFFMHFPNNVIYTIFFFISSHVNPKNFIHLPLK